MVTYQELEEQEQYNQTIASQPIPERKFNRGITKDVQQQYIERRNIAQDNLIIIQKNKQDLQQYEQQQASYNESIRKYNQEQKAIDTAYKLYERGITPGFIKGEPAYKYLVKLYKQQIIQKEYFKKQQAQQPTLEQPKEIQFSLKPNESAYYTLGDSFGLGEGTIVTKDKSNNIKVTPFTYSKPNISDIKPIELTPETLKTLPAHGYSYEQPKEIKPIKTYKVTPTEFIIGKTIIGFGENVVGLGKLTYSIYKEPLSIPKFIIKSGPTFISHPIESGKKIYNFGNTMINNYIKKLRLDPIGQPFKTVGSLASDILITRGTGVILTKGTDILRTIGLKELKAETIIAPEYYKGQNYPKIKPGQTAQELLDEFRPQLMGEIIPAGFNASPRPFKSVTIAMKGSSELPGLYIAPKLSPNFLEISGGKYKIFSLQLPKLISRPTIIRLTPNKFKLTDLVRRDTNKITGFKGSMRYKQFDSLLKSEYGEAIVPFLKTEKEAVIKIGTPIVRTAKRYFIKFEGRRVPIYEYAIDKAKVSNKVKYKPSHYDSIDNSLINPATSSLGLINNKNSLSYKSSSVSSSYKPMLTYSYKSTYTSPTRYMPSYKTPSITPTRYMPSKYPPSIVYNKYIPKHGNKVYESIKRYETGYKPFVIKNRKKYYFSGIFSKGLALRYGEDKAIKTLRATFGVEKTNILISSDNNNYTPSSKLFRSYKIKKGKRIPLMDTFIQNRNFRLSSAGEKQEILMSRRNR